MGRIAGTQVVAVVRHILTEVVREIVPAVVAISTGDVGADHDAIADLERDAFKVGVLAVSSDGSHCAHILMTLNDREADLLACVLGGESLVGVFVSATDAGQFHLHQHAAGSGLRQRVFPQFISSGLD